MDKKIIVQQIMNCTPRELQQVISVINSWGGNYPGSQSRTGDN